MPRDQEIFDDKTNLLTSKNRILRSVTSFAFVSPARTAAYGTAEVIFAIVRLGLYLECCARDCIGSRIALSVLRALLRVARLRACHSGVRFADLAEAPCTTLLRS